MFNAVKMLPREGSIFKKNWSVFLVHVVFLQPVNDFQALIPFRSTAGRSMQKHTHWLSHLEDIRIVAH